MNRKPNFANVLLSILVLMTMMLSAAQPVNVSASTAALQGDGIERGYHPQTGKLSFLGADPVNPIRVGKAMERGLSPEARGLANLQMYAGEFGIRDVERELSVMRSNSGDGRQMVRYQQVFNGIPVMAGELNVNMQEDGSLLSINGEVSPELNLDTRSRLTGEAAKRVALQAIAEVYNLGVDELTVSEPELWIFDERLMQEKATQPIQLVWRMEISSENAPVRELVLVNAQTGRISLHFNQVDTAWRGDPPIAPEPEASPERTANPVQEPAAVIPLNGQPEMALEAVRFITIPAGSLYVSTNGSDTNDCLSKDTPCKTISAAIAKLTDGQTIAVAEGVYKEWVTFLYVGRYTSNILTGGWDEAFENQTGYSTIDGENIHPGMRVPHYLTLLLDHFIIENGNSSGVYGQGGGIENNGILTILSSTIRNNRAAVYGGGIVSMGNSELTILNSTIAYNDGERGGGIFGGRVIARNTTFAYNSAMYGGAIYGGGSSAAESVFLNNVTMLGNTAQVKGSGIYHGGGSSKVNIENSIVVGSAPSVCASYVNTLEMFISKGHNLFNQNCKLTLAATDIDIANPKFGSYLSALGYMPLRSDSEAVNAGNNATCYSTHDQRGQLRVGTCDIGAFEYVTPGAAASIWVLSGNLQNTNPNQTFPLPLIATILDNGGNPVPGVPVTLEVPTAGPSALFQGTGTTTQTVTTNIAGNAVSSLLTANSEYGPFDVSASFVGGAPQPAFSLEILRWSVSPSGSDSNSCKSPAEACQSIQVAIDQANAGDTIFVAEGFYTSSADEVVIVDKNVILSGGWNAAFGAQTGYSTIDGEGIRRGITVGVYPMPASLSINHFIITNGYRPPSYGSDNETGGGIYVWRGSRLQFMNGMVTGNHAERGGGIYGAEVSELIILDSIISNNIGGGLRLHGKLTMTGCSIHDNYTDGGGGGIQAGSHSYGTISNTTIARNRAAGGAGGIGRSSSHDGDLILNNVTVTENYASISGGVGGDMVFMNSIIANNHSLFDDGVLGHHGNCDSSEIIMMGMNILYPWCPVSIGEGSVVIVRDPKLGKFIPEVGYAPLQAGSPAVNKGKNSTCAAGGDQRGQARVGICDLGAFEYVTNDGVPNRILAISGGEQRVLPGTRFPLPLVAVVLDVRGNPVARQGITFTATGTTANATFANGGTTITVQTNNGGYATTSLLTANSELGDYTVEASHGTRTATYQLSNGAWYIVPGAEGGNDLNDCKSPASACATLRGVFVKPDFHNGDIVRMARGNYPALDEDLILDREMRVNGGWDTGFLTQTGVSVLDFTLQPTHSVIAHWNAKAYLDRVGFVATQLVNRGNTVIDNGFLRDGDPIMNYGYLTVRNSTIRGNDAGFFGRGGGLYNEGIAEIQSSTIAENIAKLSGGGIYVYSGSVTLSNSIVIGNNISGGGDCSGVYSKGHNLFGIHCMGMYSRWSSTDIYGDATHPIKMSSVFASGVVMDPATGQYYYPLKMGSPAIDAGNTGVPGNGSYTCAATDQLGGARPQGKYCDIGAVEYLFNVSPPEPRIATYDARNTKSLPGTLECSGNDATCVNLDEHVVAAHQYAYSTYAKYLEWHGRDSIDGNGMQINSTVRYGNNYLNAFWNGQMMVYGDGYGFPLADDVVAHELTHGVTQYESNLFYWHQSGAINESFSDLWGELIDQTNQLGNDASNVRWLIGEDVAGLDPVRNMANPPVYDDPDSMTSTLYCETGACLNDNGGVHTNSGVNNKAAYLLVHGGTFGGRTVRALGWTKTLAIYYEAQTNLLTSGSDYLDLYNVLYQACINKINVDGITLNDCGQVRLATLAVKMNQPPAFNFNPDADYCPAGQAPLLPGIFYEDFESGIDGWTPSALGGGESRWELSGMNAKSGFGSLWADDSYMTTFSFADTRKIMLPVNSKIYLHFSHQYSFDMDSMYYYDGGVVEYALNNDWAFTDARPFFNAGQNYSGTIKKGSYSSLEGRPAFVGDSHGYVDSRYNLSSLAGKVVRIRWAMATDEIIYRLGWYLDDVRIYVCLSTPNVPVLSKPTSNALLADYTPTFDWSDSTPDLDHYQLQLATDSAFTKNLITYDDIPASTFTPTVNLSGGTRYYWRVRAVNAADKSSAWSMARNFRTAYAGPVNGAPNGITTASRKPTFTWNAVTGATSYRIQISTSNTFMTTVVDASVTTNSFTPSINLGIGSTYYWRVMVDGGLFAPGRWSAVWSFTTP